MAARRLLIVLLVLLLVSTLAAALVPQRSLNGGTSRSTTTTAAGPATTTTQVPDAAPPEVPITVPRKKPPVVLAHLGDQFTLLVTSTKPRQVSIPEFGQLGFAASDAPARFELLPTVTGTFGILFATSGKVVARLEVVEPSAKKRSRSRAPAGSGRA